MQQKFAAAAQHLYSAPQPGVFLSTDSWNDTCIFAAQISHDTSTLPLLPTTRSFSDARTSTWLTNFSKELNIMPDRREDYIADVVAGLNGEVRCVASFLCWAMI